MYEENNVGASPVFAQSSKARQNRGITLIALVITIIVMLILVGVTISMAVNGGLFDYAGKAVGDTKNAMNAEQDLGSGKIQVDGIWYDSIDDYLAGIQSENQSGGTTGGENTPDTPSGDEQEDEPITGNNGETFTAIYAETKPYTDGNGDMATIPAGYAVGTSEGINTIDTGLVIRDENGNEFVWIPVTTDLGSSYSYSSYYSEPKELTDIYSMSGAAYDSQETLDYLYGENYYTYSEDFKYAEEYAEMVEKVNQYNGFYIGRYETTIDSDGNIGSEYNTTVLTADKTLFTKDSTNYPYRWYGLYQAGKNADVTGNGSNIQTAMIYGVLWDETMQFIRDQYDAGNTNYTVDSSTAGWHNPSSGIVKSGQEYLYDDTYYAKPGADDIALNIWGLESNAYEWTQEAYSTDRRVIRGGIYSYSYKASYRSSDYPALYDTRSSARLALYIK